MTAQLREVLTERTLNKNGVRLTLLKEDLLTGDFAKPTWITIKLDKRLET